MSTRDRSTFDFHVQGDADHGDVYIELPGTFYLLPAADALALGHAIETQALRVLGLISDESHDGQETSKATPADALGSHGLRNMPAE